eukprot:6198909-Pleurochrysis_carterae.AAC.2
MSYRALHAQHRRCPHSQVNDQRTSSQYLQQFDAIAELSESGFLCVALAAVSVPQRPVPLSESKMLAECNAAQLLRRCRTLTCPQQRE